VVVENILEPYELLLMIDFESYGLYFSSINDNVEILK